MSTITQEMENCYKVAKSVYDKKTSRKEGIKKLTELKINAGSAQMIIRQIFPGMMEGKKFTRTLSAPYFEYFLSNMLQDYGVKKFSLILSSIKQHIEYNTDRNKPKNKLKVIYKKYLLLLNKPLEELSEDEKEQEEINSYLENMERNQIIDELKKLKPNEPEIVIINNKRYKRDNKTISQIKFIRGFKCQICNFSIIKKDGKKYVEAAHINQKCNAGPETPDNILILCPNHHKEFDFGNLEIINHTKSIIDFKLNGKSISLDLSLI